MAVGKSHKLPGDASSHHGALLAAEQKHELNFGVSSAMVMDWRSA
jgi:hypothetical protein